MLNLTLAKERYERYVQRFNSPVSGGGLSPVNAAIWCVILGAQEERGISGNAMEIGVWYGHGSALMSAHLASHERLLLLDKFVHEDAFIENLRDPQGKEPQIVFERTCSIVARKRGVFDDYSATVRWVHIDGEHSYEAVCNDLNLTVELSCDGGVIALDDIYSFESPGCTEALYDWLPQNKHRAVCFLGGFNKAYLCSPRDLPFYSKLAYEMPNLLDALGHTTTATRAGWSSERACVGLVPRYGNNKYTRIGEAAESMSFERFWLGAEKSSPGA